MRWMGKPTDEAKNDAQAKEYRQYMRTAQRVVHLRFTHDVLPTTGKTGRGLYLEDSVIGPELG